MKHLANMRVHLQEAYAAACEKEWWETAEVLKEITKEVDEVVKIVALHYQTGEMPNDEKVEQKATMIRRKIQKVATLIMARGEFKETFPVFMELFLATGHANNIEEHILD